MHIVKGDMVLHTLSGLYYMCENNQQARWMNMSPFYQCVPADTMPESYFHKNK